MFFTSMVVRAWSCSKIQPYSIQPIPCRYLKPPNVFQAIPLVLSYYTFWKYRVS